MVKLSPMELRLEQLTKTFNDKCAVNIQSLVIPSGEFFTFIGPNGCGKSTLLDLIAGLEMPTTGTLWAGGQRLNDLTPRDRDVAFVFHNDALCQSGTVFENIAFPLEMAKVSREKITKQVGETAALLNLTPLLSWKHSQLSDDQRQLVELGRVIVQKPRVFLFDEPFVNLDAPLRASMRRELKRLHGYLGTIFIYCTSDQEEALSLSDRIAVLLDGQVQQCATPTMTYEKPATSFVASYFGDPPINLVPAILEKDGVAVEIGNRTIQLNGAIDETYVRDVTVGIRPEHVRVLPGTETGWRAIVTFVESRGAISTVEVTTEGQHFVTIAEDPSRYQVGDAVVLRILSRHLHVFDVKGVRLNQR